jgi:hypothetical protein
MQQLTITDRQRVMVQIARRVDLLQMSDRWLRVQLLELGLGTSGSREELIERVHRAIWREAYDMPIHLRSREGRQ